MKFLADNADKPYVQNPSDAGFDPNLIAKAYTVLDRFADEGSVCGGVALIGRRDVMLPPKSFGFKSLFPQKRPNDVDTIYDCASLTKVITTATMTLTLMDQGVVRLDDYVSDFLPHFSGNITFSPNQRKRQLHDAKSRVTLRHLLTHTSGLPAWRPLYKHVTGREDIVLAAAKTPLERRPGERVVYSCIGYIVLTDIIERLTGTALDQLAKEIIFDRLKMNHACFNPPSDKKHLVAPTEMLNEENRLPGDEQIIHGVVHDENARAMGGVSGHAGLFATATDIGLFALMLMGEGTFFEERIISKASFDLSVDDHTSRLNQSRGLGWEIKGNHHGSSAGDFMSPRSFGHTGFTGTSIWIDPTKDVFVVLLTNRVHPSRENQSHLRLRPLFHNAVISSLLN